MPKGAPKYSLPCNKINKIAKKSVTKKKPKAIQKSPINKAR
jgi:hypothetical protein